ncbi:hypothetical protein [Zavarzinella formosa]|uniref:hypothetical protein n=1 Tax=Zavarzinella formosa TaxID=360055 RepID=UPI0002FA8DA8|nr:hypothetical protein [Zavarzinella formosa]
MKYGRNIRHLAGYALVGYMVLREQIDWATIGLSLLVVLVFDLPGVKWLKTKLYELAKQWVGKNDSCDPH